MPLEVWRSYAKELTERKTKKVNAAVPPNKDSKELPFSQDQSVVGIRVLFEPENASFDVVFIHGLGGHWQDTWRAKGAQVSWPQDLLPSRLQYGRILSYGYDSHISDWRRMVSQNTVTDHANNLLRDLSNHRDEDDSVTKESSVLDVNLETDVSQNDRPIFFVTHSLGGLALVRSRSSPEGHIQRILGCTKGIIFMGTPHAGTDALATWAKVLAASLGIIKQTNSHILEVLQRNSELLYRIQAEFHTLIRDRKKRDEPDIETVCFFEELPMPGIGFVVPKESATLSTYQSTGLFYDHSEMTRFRNADDPAFKAVSAELLRWSKLLQPMMKYHANNMVESEAHPPQSAYTFSHSDTIPHFPYTRNQFFVGCDDILQNIEIRLREESRVALNGIGGVGKSEIAIEYCYRFWTNHPEVSIFWVTCDNLNKIELAFRRIAQILSLPGLDDPDIDMIELVSHHFQRGDAQPCLLVLDNADDVELFSEGDNALARVIPTYRGDVIVTTRDRHVAQAFTGTARGSLTIDRLSSKDSSTLFRSKLPNDVKIDEVVEMQILEILEHLPLCITQAAAYIDRSDVSLPEYLLELTESESSLLEVLDEDHIDLRRGFDSPNSVLRAWKLSFEKINGRYAQAGELLSVMAFLDRQCISRDLLQDLFESRHQLNKALGTLQGFCLIVAESSGDSFRMHRLVQLATRFWLFSKKTDYEALAMKLVATSFDRQGIKDERKRRLLIPHAKVVEKYSFQDKDRNLILATLQFRIAFYDLHAGHYDTAAQSCQSAYAKQAAFCGESHLDTLHSAGLFGVIKQRQGLYQEANSLQREVLSKKETVLGPENLDTIDTLSDLSEVLERQGEYAASQAFAERAFKVRESRLGENDLKTLQILMHLALLLRRQAQYKDAEAIYRKVSKGYEGTLPEIHETRLKCAYSLAGVLRETGQIEEAVAISEKVVEGRKILLGDDHCETLFAINNLGLGYRLQGQLERAEQLYRDIMVIYNNCRMFNHPEVLQVNQNLAVVLRDQGKYEEAERIGRHTLEHREHVLGAENLSTVHTALDLAITLEHRKAYAEASALASRVLAVRTRKLGEKHTYTLETLFTTASIDQHLGRLEEAQANFRVVLDGQIRTLGPHHPATRETADRLSALTRSLTETKGF